MSYPTFTLALPRYVTDAVPDPRTVYPEIEDRMRLVIELARINIDNGGGPFGAGVFCLQTRRLIAPGVNLVVPTACSAAHAEMVALILAQQAVGSYTLADAGDYELITSAEPCSQCYGAIPWSGVRSLAYGADRIDVEAIGFDEGPKPHDWISTLEEREITVRPHILRCQAVALLEDYAGRGFPIYNAD
jgi:tRNA(Arg) A34 adenosine deaminase TadA